MLTGTLLFCWHGDVWAGATQVLRLAILSPTQRWLSMYLPNAQYNLCCDLQLLQKEGTVTAAPNCNSSGDAGVLEQAIKAKGELDVHTGKLWSMSQDVSDLETVIVLEVWHVGLQWKNFNILCWPSCTITAPSLITVVES